MPSAVAPSRHESPILSVFADAQNDGWKAAQSLTLHSSLPRQDVGFAINQLVEVAVRTLSPGVNDPFTALTSIDRLTTALLHLMRPPWPSRFRVDDNGDLRLIADGADFDSVVDAAFHQVRRSGAGMPAVMIHLLESLQVLLEEAKSPAHRATLQRHLDLVSRAALRETEEPADRRDVGEAARSDGVASASRQVVREEPTGSS